MASWWPWQKVQNRGTYARGGKVTKQGRFGVGATPPKVAAKPVAKAAAKPAVQRVQAKPIVKPALSNYGPGGGGAMDTMGPASTYPPADFPMDPISADYSPSSVLLGEQANLMNMQRQLGQRDIDQATTDLKAQLAQQLGSYQTKRGYLTEDAARARSEYQRRLPIQQRQIMDSAAARGAALSEGRKMGQDEVQRATDEAIQNTDRDLNRDLESLSKAEEEAKLDAARQEREVRDKQDAFDLEAKADDLRAKADDARSRAAATKAGIEANASKAKHFMSTRTNQLMAHGMDERNARAKALDEARSKFTGVSMTELEGAFKPVAAGKKGIDPIVKKWGDDISVTRASKISAKTQDRMRKDQRYSASLPVARTYIAQTQRSGTQPSLQEFLDFYGSWVQAQGANAKQTINKSAGYLSVLAADLGLI